MIIHDLGLIEYSLALAFQEKCLEEVNQARNADLENPDHEQLIICEHPLVATVGRGQDAAQDILSKNLTVFEVSRGGRATLHLPGQIVLYPILDLTRRGKDVEKILRLLETLLIETLADFRISAQVILGKTGVWTLDENPKKIASIGIAARNWISYHGLALNVTCDLKEFKSLKPCGFDSSVMTSMWEMASESYKKTWELQPQEFLKHVKMRLIENAKDLLELKDEPI